MKLELTHLSEGTIQGIWQVIHSGWSYVTPIRAVLTNLQDIIHWVGILLALVVSAYYLTT